MIRGTQFHLNDKHHDKDDGDTDQTSTQSGRDKVKKDIQRFWRFKSTGKIQAEMDRPPPLNSQLHLTSLHLIKFVQVQIN